MVSAANGTKGSTASGAIVVDGPTLFLQGAILLLSVLGVLTMAERFSGGPESDAFTPQGAAIPGSPQEAAAVRAGLVTTEIFPLTLFAVGGMLLFPAAGDLLTMFVALEVLSLPLYVLCGLARRRRLLSQEAALKYFLLGSVLLGVLPVRQRAALRVRRDAQPRRHRHGDLGREPAAGPAARPASAWSAIGLLFKIGAVPFHSWTPDVYQGAPTPVTGFMAACTKIAAFGAVLRVVYVGVAGARWDWQPVLWAVAIITMLAGSVLAITQTDVKRMLAYSSIAHAGFVLVGVLAFDKSGVSGTLFYLAAYGFIDDRGVRGRQPGAGQRRRGHPPVAVGRPRQGAPARRGHVRAVPARLRRHPADVRLHRPSSPCSHRPWRTVPSGWSWSAWSPVPSRRSSTSGSSC